ncbi:MAG: tRNA lysidine(34) synthetase TilS [bacterium]
MFLFFCVHSWYTQNKRDTKKIIIAHYNHKQRKESTNEQAFLQKYFSDYTFYYNTDKPNQGSSETELRTMRHIFFNEVCEKEKASFLLLGHNLTDRVETSILSMVRGAGIDGVLGIKATQDKKKYIILRPLISLEKQYITKQCIELRIPYFVDTTNSQPITSRNILRNDIVPSIQSLHIG